ncbi:MAG: hypothetical protein Q4G25_15660, partial [Paracoccus sp. (in: a-proteobacteria)]|nr:hypothetical protein [Paracoccus sp. (in: a-proteobacteria)]
MTPTAGRVIRDLTGAPPAPDGLIGPGRGNGRMAAGPRDPAPVPRRAFHTGARVSFAATSRGAPSSLVRAGTGSATLSNIA